jgi:hypothetical protein
MAEKTLRLIGKATVPGAYLCDLIPIFKHSPPQVPFRKEAATGRSMIEDLVTKPFQQVEAEIVGCSSP